MNTPFIPKGTEWFIAEIVVESNFPDQSANLVQINMILIRANAPEVAYQKAIVHGESENRVFMNTDGVEVRVRFRGLRGLYVVYEPLEDGAELLYDERNGLSEEAIAN